MTDEEELERYFNEIDLDGGGTVSVQELKDWCAQSSGRGRSWHPLCYAVSVPSRIKFQRLCFAKLPDGRFGPVFPSNRWFQN